MDAVGFADLDVDQSGGGERRLVLGAVSAPAMQPVHCSMSARVASSMSGSAMTSETAKRPPARRTRAASRRTRRLVGGEVDDAVGDDDVDARVGERDLLDVALDELGVVDAGLGGVGPCEREHLVGHVEADRAPAGADARALMSTSAPAPEPRSSTVSPACRSATAVGTPQPSEAATAAGGAPTVSSPA